MKSAKASELERSHRIEYVSAQLLARSSALTRMLAKQVNSGLSQTERKVLNTLRDGSRRITDLAEFEGLAQPTTTQLVKRLEKLGLVKRERQTDDGRVVLVSLEPAGLQAYEDYREKFTALFRDDLAAASDEQVETLAAATEALETIITRIQQPRGFDRLPNI